MSRKTTPFTSPHVAKRFDKPKNHTLLPQPARFFKIALIFICLLLSNLTTLLFAQEQPQKQANIDNTQNSNYPASFFVQYLPQNALEMVQRLPGFNLDLGQNARGFGANAGNVLIDGARPTSKAGGLRNVLVRIPSSQVERIEILRGGISSGEASGQSIIANVIRYKNITTGSWAFKQRFVEQGKSRSNLEAAMTTRLGEWDTSFNIDIGEGPRYRSANIETLDENNNLILAAKENVLGLNKFVFVNGEGITELADGRLTLSTRVGANQRKRKTQRDIAFGQFPNGDNTDQLWQLSVNNELDLAELGADWSQNANDWRWRIIGLGLIQNNRFANRFNLRTLASGESVSSRFSQKSRSSEFIGRITYGKNNGAAFKPEFGVELAKNKLTSDSIFFANEIQQPLNGGDATVQELRSEVFSSFIYSASNQSTIEGGLTAEVSSIEVSGDSSQQQTFVFLKPRLLFTYKYNSKQQIAVELVRRVGQLNFSDFAASSQASDDRTTSGNPNLAPDKVWEISTTYDWSFSERGSLKIKSFYQWRQEILEQIILPTGGQGIGNAGNARFWGIESKLNLPLDPVLQNGLIEIVYVYRDSSFNDPITDRTRIVSGYVPKRLIFTLRQDLIQHKLSWGIEYLGNFTNSNFFVDEKQSFRNDPQVRFFIESSQFFGVKTQLEINQVNNTHFDRTRLIYQDNRNGVFSGSEIAHRLRHKEIKLTFSQNF